MKERKKFFDNNCLNKGHKKISNLSQSDVNVVRKKYQHVLPPIDMLEHYEELNPGTLDKLLGMAEREQNHRHSIDLISMEKHNRANTLGKVFALVFVSFISITALMLVIVGSIVVAAVLIFSAFACITIVSYFYSKNSLSKEFNGMKSSKPGSSKINKNIRK